MVAFMFVHGTGVREAAYTETLKLLRRGLAEEFLTASVHPCYWGRIYEADDVTDPAEKEGATTPGDIDLALASEDEDAVAWGVLYEDPVAPLRQLGGAGADRSGELWLGDRSEQELELRARALAAAPPDELGQLLDRAGAGERFPLVVSAVLATDVCQAALGGADEDGLLPSALATAFVARLLGDGQRAGLPMPWSTAQRDDAVALISGELGEEHRGLGLLALGAHGWAAHRFGVMRAVEKRRDKWLESMALPTGDILRYLARGQALRDAIEEDVTEVCRREGSVILVAHSLGGIASVDLLAQCAIPGVRHLVTLGSQAGYLYRNGALPGLEPGRALPEHFPRWTNVIDRRDLLAFEAEPHFAGRVRDVEAPSGEPFPVSHSAYFSNRAVHRLLADALRECG